MQTSSSLRFLFGFCFFFYQADRHLPTMTVEETFKFAFDSMSGGTHGQPTGEGNESFSDEQKELVSWMDGKYMKVSRTYVDYVRKLCT